MAKAPWTDTQITSQLNSGYLWTGSNLTYGFPTDASWFPYAEAGGFSTLTAAQRTAATLAIRLWDDLMAPDFTLASSANTANVRYSNTTTNISYAHAYYPGTGTGYGSVWFNPNYNSGSGTNDLVTPVVGNWGWTAYVHETGHSVGMAHAGNYNGGSPTYATDAAYFQDSQQYSIMSYFTADNTGADWYASNGQWYYPQTPMVNDIMAIQAMYGVETTTRTGNTTYGFNSNADVWLYDFTLNPHPVLSVFDSAGIDTFDFSGFGSASRIDLNPGAFSDADMMTYNISIARTAWIENAIGGIGNDVLIGNVLANTLTGNGGDDGFTGGAGNDTIFGGAGNDTATYSGNFANYSISWNATAGAYVLVDTRGGSPDGTDTVKDVETFVFADGARTAASLLTVSTTSYSIAPLVASALESAGQLTFTVTRTGDISAAGTVNYAATGSGANPVNGTDFVGGVLPASTVNFAAGVATQTIALNVQNDTIAEADEGVTVTLSAASGGAGIGTGSAAGTILNDDTAPPVISIAATDASKAEGDSGATLYSFTITRTGDISAAGTVNWNVAGGTATAADFSNALLPSGIAIFAANQASQVITVSVAGDGTVEADESFNVNLSAPSNGATLGTASAIGTILNDDSAFSIAALDANKAEGNSGTTPFTFTVTRSGNLSGTESVAWSVTGSGATPATADDFVNSVFPGGTLTFTAGQTSQIITINVAGDVLLEANEGFTVSLSAPAGASAPVGITSLGTTVANAPVANVTASRIRLGTQQNGAGTPPPPAVVFGSINPPSSGTVSVATASATGTILNDETSSAYTGTPYNDMFNAAINTATTSFDISQGGNDTVIGGSGNDSIMVGGALTAADSINGGGGTDVLTLSGDYAAGVSLSATTLTNVERITLAAANSYKLTTNDATVAAGATLTIDATALGIGNGATVNGGLETNGGFVFLGGAGRDVFTGGAGNDIFRGGLGADLLAGGTGVDVFVYGDAADSPLTLVSGQISLTGDDQISGFAVSSDKIDLSVFVFTGSAATLFTHSTNGITSMVGTGAGFFSGSGVAIDYTRTGKTAQLYVDANHDGNLNAGDLLIQLSGVSKGSFTTSNIAF